jgi:hypothetical protein
LVRFKKTLTAFIGGQAQFFFLEINGFNPIRGLFWLTIVDPIVLAIAYWIFMLLMLPLIGLVSGATALANSCTFTRHELLRPTSFDSKVTMDTTDTGFRTTRKLDWFMSRIG